MPRPCLAIVLAALLCAAAARAAPLSSAELATVYRQQVDRRLEIPPVEEHRYAQLAEGALAQAGIRPGASQYVAVVDRDANAQVLLLYWRAGADDWQLVGASPVSTGRPGSFDHFDTPLGVFDHTVDNPDFRAEGTFNENGIRGYGVRGMRVFDFGWQRVPKGWGDGAVIEMRLQLHATDPDALEPRLGTRQSKGCIRVPATLVQLLDRFGILDADYERVLAQGRKPWVLPEEREPVAGAGRYLVVVDTDRAARPAWHPLPRAAR